MSYSFSIATWNINSIRLRQNLVEQFLQQFSPDVLCLQETKCPNTLFPYAPFEALGYKYIISNGQKGYHGVATLSRYPIFTTHHFSFCDNPDCRHLATGITLPHRQLMVHNFYVPAGGDEPNPKINPKFDHKLRFVEEMKQLRSQTENQLSCLLVGDLNIAPHPTDVWSHKQLLNVVSHTPIETDLLKEVLKIGNWCDFIYAAYPPPQQPFTWWSYRAKDWQKSNRGRRLDHIWGDPQLLPNLQHVEIFNQARSFLKPSDHVPIIAQFKF